MLDDRGRSEMRQDALGNMTDFAFALDNVTLKNPKILNVLTSIVKHYDAEKSSVIGNTGKLHQVFTNIISNAIDAIENDEGTIKLRIQQEDKNNISIEIKTKEALNLII